MLKVNESGRCNHVGTRNFRNDGWSLRNRGSGSEVRFRFRVTRRYTTTIEYDTEFLVCLKLLFAKNWTILLISFVWMSTYNCLTCKTTFENNEEREKYPFAVLSDGGVPSCVYPFQVRMALL